MIALLGTLKMQYSQFFFSLFLHCCVSPLFSSAATVSPDPLPPCCNSERSREGRGAVAASLFPPPPSFSFSFFQPSIFVALCCIFKQATARGEKGGGDDRRRTSGAREKKEERRRKEKGSSLQSHKIRGRRKRRNIGWQHVYYEGEGIVLDSKGESFQTQHLKKVTL